MLHSFKKLLKGFKWLIFKKIIKKEIEIHKLRTNFISPKLSMYVATNMAKELAKITNDYPSTIVSKIQKMVGQDWND